MLLNFIKLPFVVKTFVLSIFERPFYTGFALLLSIQLLLSFSIIIIFCISLNSYISFSFMCSSARIHQ